jgi:divalent metal cation (Fe/Co/Zn/Cd) transporter
MTVEVVASIIAGLFVGKSLALLAFGGDSVVELISAYAVLQYLVRLNKGFVQTESESEKTQKLETALLISLFPIIIFGSIYSYFSGIKPESSTLGIAVSMGAVIIMPILWIQKKRIGIMSNIPTLTLDAVESATCFFMAVALLGGLTVNYLFGLYWVDYIATAIILGFVVLEVRESMTEIRTD